MAELFILTAYSKLVHENEAGEDEGQQLARFHVFDNGTVAVAYESEFYDPYEDTGERYTYKSLSSEEVDVWLRHYAPQIQAALSRKWGLHLVSSETGRLE